MSKCSDNVSKSAVLEKLRLFKTNAWFNKCVLTSKQNIYRIKWPHRKSNRKRVNVSTLVTSI